MPVNAVYNRRSDNVATLGTLTVNTGTEDPEYLAANLVDLDPASPAKLTTTSGSWQWEYVARQRIDLISLFHHNFSAGLSVRFQGNDTAVWTSPTFDQAITIPAAQLDLYPTNAHLALPGLTGYTTAGFFFWRLLIGTNSAPISVGEVWLGSIKRAFSPNVSWGVQRELKRKIVQHETDFGVTAIFDLGVTTRAMKGELDTTDAGTADYEALWRSTRGRTYPWLCLPFGDDTEPWLVRFDRDSTDITHQVLDRNVLAFGIEEVARGLRP